jgi:head-tail adaptor
MKSPRLNRRLVLEAQERLPDGAGGFVASWAEIGVLWAEVGPRTGNDRAEPGGTVAHVGYQIVVRAAPFGSPARPVPGQRLREGMRSFAIRAVADHDTEGRYLTCFADEEVAV